MKSWPVIIIALTYPPLVATSESAENMLKEVAEKSCPIPIYDIIRKNKDPTFLRYQMVRFALSHAIKPTPGRAFGVNRKTVRKWLRRYQKDSIGGLVDRR